MLTNDYLLCLLFRIKITEGTGDHLLVVDGEVHFDIPWLDLMSKTFDAFEAVVKVLMP